MSLGRLDVGVVHVEFEDLIRDDDLWPASDGDTVAVPVLPVVLGWMDGGQFHRLCFRTVENRLRGCNGALRDGGNFGEEKPPGRTLGGTRVLERESHVVELEGVEDRMVIIGGQVYDDVIPFIVSINGVETEIRVGLIPEYKSAGPLKTL